MIVVKLKCKEDQRGLLRKVKKMREFTEELEECLEDAMEDSSDYDREDEYEDETPSKSRYSYRKRM